MAGDWIKMRHDLPDDPAVITIAEGTGLSEDEVIGKLFRLWSWADRQTVSGDAPGVTEKWLTRFIGSPSFVQHMIAVGWLKISEGGITFPHFGRHMSQTAKERGLANRRMTKYRARKSACKSDDVSVTPASTREEKSKERSIEATEFSEIDWPEVLHDANQHGKTLAGLNILLKTNKANRRLVLQVCVVIRCGLLPVEWLEEAIEALAERADVKKPAAYLTRCLGNGAKDRGVDFAALRRRIKVPAEMLERKESTTGTKTPQEALGGPSTQKTSNIPMSKGRP